MAKSLLRLEARKLRKKGVSVKKIAQHLNIAKSTASLWVRDIILSVEQLEELRKSKLAGGELGRLKSALMQKQRRLDLVENSRLEGVRLLSNITDNELLIAGLALYWGEGAKKRRIVEFCNSDPKMIKFLLLWLQKCFAIDIAEIRCYVGINGIHHQREQVVKEYWSKITGIPLSQFTKTSFKKVKNKKVYNNFNEHYGTLSVKVRNPARFYYKIMGLIDGLYEAGSGLVSRGVS